MRLSCARPLWSAALATLCLALPLSATELRVGAATSLRGPVEAGVRAFEAARPGLRVRVSYGASSALAFQIRAGAPLDVLLSADVQIAHELARAGLAEPPQPLARNRLVVVVAPGVSLRAPEDLLGVGRIAVPEHAVPVGHYARQWLAGRGLLEALRPQLVPTEHARATLAAVEHGAVDAALVYATDARLARRAVVAFEIPSDEQPEIVYAVCVLRDSRAPERARDFVAWWRAEPGRSLLEVAGFAVGAP